MSVKLYAGHQVVESLLNMTCVLVKIIYHHFRLVCQECAYWYICRRRPGRQHGPLEYYHSVHQMPIASCAHAWGLPAVIITRSISVQTNNHSSSSILYVQYICNAIEDEFWYITFISYLYVGILSSRSSGWDCRQEHLALSCTLFSMAAHLCMKCRAAPTCINNFMLISARIQVLHICNYVL